MIYTNLTKKALKISFDAHKNQVDKSNMPYVYHPFHLAEQMDDEYSTCVALLHDVVEDTNITLDDLKREGFPVEVTDALALMTHDDTVDYLDYVREMKDNVLARKVKLADLAHNSDLSRLDKVDDKALERVKKYRQAILILEKAERDSRIKKVPGKLTLCCGKIVPEEYKYCPSCGEEIINAKEAELELDLDETLTSCAKCGRLLILYGHYCGYCGKRPYCRIENDNANTSNLSMKEHVEFPGYYHNKWNSFTKKLSELTEHNPSLPVVVSSQSFDSDSNIDCTIAYVHEKSTGEAKEKIILIYNADEICDDVDIPF